MKKKKKKTSGGKIKHTKQLMLVIQIWISHCAETNRKKKKKYDYWKRTAPPTDLGKGWEFLTPHTQCPIFHSCKTERATTSFTYTRTTSDKKKNSAGFPKYYTNFHISIQTSFLASVGRLFFSTFWNALPLLAGDWKPESKFIKPTKTRFVFTFTLIHTLDVLESLVKKHHVSTD